MLSPAGDTPELVHWADRPAQFLMKARGEVAMTDLDVSGRAQIADGFKFHF